MRRLFKRSLLLICAVAGVGLLGIVTVNQFVLPIRVRGWAESSLTQALGRRVTIGRIRLNPWHGVMIEDVTVAEDARYGKGPFLHVERISGQILVLPLLRQRQIIIPILWIIHPRGQLIQDPNGLWNSQTVQWRASTGKAASRPFRLLVPKIMLTDGELNVQLQKPDHPLSVYLEDLHLQASISLPAQIGWFLTARFSPHPNSPPELYCATRIHGTYDLKTKIIHNVDVVEDM